ncbi:hypothetical protein VPH35_055992 [Triticum aestivum]
MGVVGQQEVEVLESCMVKPSVETPSHGLWLSQLDLKMVNRGHTPNVYFYTPHSGAVGNFFDVARLKAAMAKALVPFYPLAGRLGVDGEGQPEIDCAGQGVLFVVARSDLTVDGFVDFQPSPELRRLFVPRVEDSPSIMCAIQVTFMGCGGVALGTALHHVAIDAVSAVHFFQTWSGFCRDGDAAAAVLELPCHDRTLLRARSPPVVHPDALTVFSCPKLSLAVSAEPSGAVVNKIFVLSNDQSAGHRVGGAGLRRPPDQWRGRQDGRRAGAFGDRLLGDKRQEQAAPEQHAGDGAEGGELAGHAGIRRGFRVGEAPGDAPRRAAARRDGLPHGRRQREWRRAHPRVYGGCDSQRLPAPAICQLLVGCFQKPPVSHVVCFLCFPKQCSMPTSGFNLFFG